MSAFAKWYRIWYQTRTSNRRTPWNTEHTELILTVEQILQKHIAELQQPGHFGKARKTRGSHRVFKTPWADDPRLNLQKDKGGRGKPYQVKQVLTALQKLAKQDE